MAATTLDAEFAALKVEYERLHKLDSNHHTNQKEWLDFEEKCREIYEKKSAQVKTNMADEVKYAPMALMSVNELAAQTKDEDLTVPHQGHPHAKRHNHQYHEIVLKQSDSFMRASKKHLHELHAKIAAEEEEERQKRAKPAPLQASAKPAAATAAQPHPTTLLHSQAATQPQVAAQSVAAAPAAPPAEHHNFLMSAALGVIHTAEHAAESLYHSAEHAVESLTGAAHLVKEESVKDMKVAVSSLEKKLKKVAYVPFSDYDPAWAKAALEALWHVFTDRAKYYVEPDVNKANKYTYPLPHPIRSTPTSTPHLRIAIAGDMGTNDDTMKNLLKGMLAQNPQIIIHLGDIYVAGTPYECKTFWESFVSVFPDKTKRIPLWSLPGNHEYISAGEGYFTELIKPGLFGDPDNGNPQEASYFSLESAELKLQILAVDTGYNSKNFSLPLGGEQMDYSTTLHPKEAEWAQERLAHARIHKWRTILLSHHQFYSAFWDKKSHNITLGEQVLNVGQPITAWLWGHEHRVGIYEAGDEKVRSGQCLGHGAIPEMEPHGYKTENTKCKFDESYTPKAVKVYENQENIYNVGFAMMEIKGEEPFDISMKYFQVDRITGVCESQGKIKLLS